MSWFDLVKRVFISEGKARSDKEKRRRWIFGRFKLKLLPTPAARSQLKPRTLSEAEEQHSKHALTVAIATVAAAEAAVAAAHAAAEVVRLTSNPQSHPQHESERRELAALRIQSAFRGYLARKALRALKGLVRIQAMVRGRAVRRKAITTLKGLQSLVKIQSQIHARRVRMVEDSWASEEKLQLLRQNKELGAKERRLKPNIQRWGDSLLSKEEIDAIFLSRREALINREHTDKFLSIHQEKRNVQRATESELNKADGQWNNWLEKWVDAKVCKRQGPQILDSIVCSNSVHRVEEGGTQHRLREFQSYEHLGTSSPISLPRRSFHQPKRSSIGENDSVSSSPAVPSYMAATESAKAKTRSVSMVKQRMGLLDAYSDQSSPSKNSLSFFSSISSDGTRMSKIGQPSGSEQRSPHTKGRSGPIKSHQISKDLSFDSQRSLLNWDQHISFR